MKHMRPGVSRAENRAHVISALVVDATISKALTSLYIVNVGGSGRAILFFMHTHPRWRTVMAQVISVKLYHKGYSWLFMVICG